MHLFIAALYVGRCEEFAMDVLSVPRCETHAIMQHMEMDHFIGSLCFVLRCPLRTHLYACFTSRVDKITRLLACS